MYTQSVVDIAKGTLISTARMGWAVGQRPFMRFVGVPVILLGIYLEDKSAE